jgi:hypothetical protein
MFYGNGKEFQLVDLTHFLAVRRTFFQESRGISITNAPDREFSRDHNPWKRSPAASGRALPLAEAHFVERFRDPGPLVLMRLQPFSLEQRIGILVPERLREIMP